MDTLGNDGLGVHAKACGLGSPIGVNRNHKLCDPRRLAAQVRDERMPIGGTLDEDGNRPISLAEASKVVAQIGKIGLFTKLVDEIAGVAREIPRLYDRISTTSSSGHPSIDTKHNRPGRRWPKKGGEVIGSDRGQGLVVIVLL